MYDKQPASDKSVCNTYDKIRETNNIVLLHTETDPTRVKLDRAQVTPIFLHPFIHFMLPYLPR